MLSSSSRIRDLLDSFRLRSTNTVIKFATHRALLDGRNVINRDDLVYSINLVRMIIFSLIDQIEMSKEFAKYTDSSKDRWFKFRQDRMYILKNITKEANGTIAASEFRNLITEYFNVSNPSAYKIMDEWDKNKFI